MGKETHLKLELKSGSDVTALLGRIMANRPTVSTLEFAMTATIRDDNNNNDNTTKKSSGCPPVPLSTICTIFDMIGTLPCLERLTISGNDVPLRPLGSVLVQAAASLQELALVDLTFCKFSKASDFELLAESTQILQNLRRICLENIRSVDLNGWTWLLRHISELPLLEEVCVDQIYVQDDANPQTRNPCIPRLETSFENFGKSNSLQTLKMLDPIDILSPQCLVGFFQQLAANNASTQLEEIHLAYDRASWDLDCIYALAEMLLVNETLQVLRIGVHDDFLPPALQSLQCNETLRVFWTNYDRTQQQNDERFAQREPGAPLQDEDMNDNEGNHEDNDDDDDDTNRAETTNGPLQNKFAAMLKQNSTLTELKCDEDFSPEMSMYLNLNKAGRKLLLEDTDQRATRDDWVRAIMEFSHDTSVVFYFLTRNPSLIATLGCPGNNDVKAAAAASSSSWPNPIKRKTAPPRDEKQSVEELKEEYESRIMELKKLHIAELSERDQQLAVKDSQMKQLVNKWNYSLRSLEGKTKRIKVRGEHKPSMQELQSMLQSLMRTTTTLESKMDNNPKKRVPEVWGKGSIVSRKKGRTSPFSTDSTDS